MSLTIIIKIIILINIIIIIKLLMEIILIIQFQKKLKWKNIKIIVILKDMLKTKRLLIKF